MKKLFLLLIPFLLLVACDQGSGPDTTQPTTQITLDGATNAGGAYTDSVKVTVSAADTGGSGLSKTEYSLNGAAFQPYSQPFTLTTPGEYTVSARATDGSGNEGTSQKTFSVAKSGAPNDTVAPTVDITLGGATDASGAYQGKATVTIAAADTGGSNLAAVEYSLDNAPFIPYTAPLEVGISGSHTVTARASDNAANTTTATKTFTVVGGQPGDTTKPTVRVSLNGAEKSPNVYEESVTVTVKAEDEESSSLAVTYSLDGGSFESYSGPFEVTDLGEHTVVAKAADDAGNVGETTRTFQVVSETLPPAPPANAAAVKLENLGGAPYDDRLVFNRIQNPQTGENPDPNGNCCPPPNVVRNTATVRVTNTGGAPLNITALPISGPWVLEPAPTLPVTVPVGASLDLTLRFVANNKGSNDGVYEGKITIVSSASGNQYEVVELGGFWQAFSERGLEPTLEELVEVFGYQTVITKPGEYLNQAPGNPAADDGAVEKVGDEILAPYWQRANAGQPVTVRQLAAYHGQGSVAGVAWFEKNAGFNRNQIKPKSLFTHVGDEAQTILPSKIGGGLAVATFSPDGVFGFKVDTEWSNWTFNPVTDKPDEEDCPDRRATNPLVVCGHNIRFWPLKDRSGNVVPNTYLMGMDYSGPSINYDYNDNLYLVSNVKPSEEGVPYSLDVAGDGPYTDTNGDLWLSDSGVNVFTLYKPSSAPPESRGTPAIANTADDELYWTYRGRINGAAQDQRQLIYNLPLSTGTYSVTLYFAELFWTEPGKRVFDVSVEGALRLDNFDIFAQSGGQNTAITRTFSNIGVTDGNLTIVFDPSMDYASIAAIKVTK